MRKIIAFSAAIFVPTCFMVLWYLFGQFATFEAGDPYIWVRTRSFLVLCLGIATAHVVVLGVPAYLLLRWRNMVRWWSTMLCGFTLGAIPVAVISWPLSYAQSGSSASVDGVETMVNGAITVAGWLQYLSGVSFFGALGTVGATAFWLIWRMSPNYEIKRTPEVTLRSIHH